jgi:glyoxylase-like metal-dependent hydrolase (beta-lactamase superfamily II)
MIRNVLLMSAAALAFVFVPGAAFPQDASAVLKRASGAMDEGELKSIRYAGEGTGFTYGQAFKPGTPWPKINVHSQIKTINYETASMRDEITLSRAEPKGGGGYPPVAQQKNDQFVSGGYAWNQAAAGPLPGPRFVADRVHQLWITPHGVLKAAMKNKATLKKPAQGGGKGLLTAVSFTEPGRFAATAFINKDGLVERVESRLPDPVLGETTAVTRYSDYRDYGGVKFPSRIRQSQGGFPVLDLAVKEVQPNAPADIQLPDAVRNAAQRVTTEKVAEGVWHVAGGSHNSVAIEMKDHIVLVETPLNDGRSGPVLEEVKKLAPGKPIRYVVNSHGHFDHSGGLRAAVAEGATIITQAGNKAYFERAFATPNKLNPDRLAKSGKKAKFRTVKEKLVLNDGSRSIEIHRIGGGDHSDTFIMAYLPKEKLLIEADAFTPLPPNSPPPEKANPNHLVLVANIERLKLSIDRILPLHGRVVPLADLYAAVKAPMPQ